MSTIKDVFDYLNLKVVNMMTPWQAYNSLNHSLKWCNLQSVPYLLTAVVSVTLSESLRVGREKKVPREQRLITKLTRTNFFHQSHVKRIISLIILFSSLGFIHTGDFNELFRIRLLRSFQLILLTTPVEAKIIFFGKELGYQFLRSST